MGKTSSRHPHLTRTATGLAAAAALFLAPGTGSAAAASTSTATRPASALPPGAVRLDNSANCPFNSLCIYRDYNFGGPGYVIPAGYAVDLNDIPMRTGSGTAANNISSWINNTGYTVQLIDYEGTGRALYPGYSLEEPPETNDSVDAVNWLA